MELDKESIDVLNAAWRTAPPQSDEDLAGAVATKKHSKSKKKDSSFLYGNEMSEILKSSQSPEQKLKAVCDRYSETLHANRKLMMANKVAESRIVKLQQENEQCQQQRSKAVLTRSRLENLCRELQKLNKAQKEEIDLKLRLEEEKRKEISATFQSAFAEMNTLTNQNTEKNTKMREENLEMREKIKSVRDRVELSEQQLDTVRQQAQFELQLAEAKLAAVRMELTAEKECLLKEKQQLLVKLTEYQVRIGELQATEVGLRSQISMYTEKYDDFQNALTKSNELFSGFNEEMEKMSKKILKLEKETSLWKQRWEKSHAALLEMAADKHARDNEMGKLTHKLSLLQELCKAFQRERTELLAQLRAVNVTNGTTTTLNVDNLKIDNVDIKQVEELSADCHKLVDNLTHMQQSSTDPINQDKKTDESPIKSTTEQTNNLTECKPIQCESNVESCDDNRTAKDEIVLECVEKIQYDEQTDDNKRKSDKIDESNDQVKQIEPPSQTPVNDNKLNDVIAVTQCNENNELSTKECVNDEFDDLIVALNQVEMVAVECPKNVEMKEQSMKNKTDLTAIVSADENVECKSNNDACMATEVKKECITKQNNSNATKKSSGKRKKK